MGVLPSIAVHLHLPDNRTEQEFTDHLGLCHLIFLVMQLRLRDSLFMQESWIFDLTKDPILELVGEVRPDHAVP